MYAEIKNITKKYGDTVVVKDADFGIEKGKLVALIGPSGSGKTTILRMIAGLEKPTSGKIFIDDRCINDLHPRDRGVGFVFQSYALFRYMTVFENISFGLDIKKMQKKEVKKRVNELLVLTGLTGLEKRYPNELSGGQRQRVAFARALAVNPSLLLLDEPFAAIDAKVRKELRTWLRDMIRKMGITSIFVTHDQDEAVEVADEIIVMSEGRIEQIGTPTEIYKNPRTPFVAQFIGQGSVIVDYSRIKGFDEFKDQYKSAVVRPEFVEAFKPDNLDFKEMIDCTDEGEIEDISFLGSALELKIKLGAVTLYARRSLERREVHIGEKMRVLVYRMFAFDDSRVCLLENMDLKNRQTHSKPLESYLYGKDGYFVG